MAETNLWNEELTEDKGIPTRFFSTKLLIALVLGAGIGLIVPFIMNVLPVNIDQIERIVGTLGPAFWGLCFGTIGMILILLLRQDELAAIVVIVVSLCVDWFLGIYILAQLIALALLLIFFLAQSPRYPWAVPRALWLWGVFLVLTIPPTIRGATTVFDTFYYYPDLILGALIMFWLGTIIARDVVKVRRFFILLAVFATFIALHIIVEAATGKLLLTTTSVATYIETQGNYHLAGGVDISRLGSFFVQPDSGSAFLAMMLFIPLGLFVESSSLLNKVIYFIEILLIGIALLFTYSTGALLAACAGIIAFVALVGSVRYRVLIPLYIFVVAMVIFIGFPSQVNLLLQHAIDPRGLLLRQGLWETGLRVIRAFPLTGVGLGRQVYLKDAELYRVPIVPYPYNNPHNSYLEWAAMAGLPVLVVFLALLAFALWQALRNWVHADAGGRSLLASGIAAIIVLSVNSWSFGLWTMPPIAACGWLILGVIASPLLAKKRNSKLGQEQSITAMYNA